MEHITSKKVTHSGAGDDDRATYTVTCSCGRFTVATDSRAAADRHAQAHVSAASIAERRKAALDMLAPNDGAPHNYSHSVDTCKACHERSLGF